MVNSVKCGRRLDYFVPRYGSLENYMWSKHSELLELPCADRTLKAQHKFLSRTRAWDEKRAGLVCCCPQPPYLSIAQQRRVSGWRDGFRILGWSSSTAADKIIRKDRWRPLHQSFWILLALILNSQKWFLLQVLVAHYVLECYGFYLTK